MTEPSEASDDSPRPGDATRPIDRDALERLIAELADRGDASGAPPSPREVGAFVVHEQVGRGSMGAVYRATHRQLNRAVALKILPEAAAASAASRARFLREARALARVDHPNVVRIYDVFEAGGTLAIAMELVDGPPLSELIATLLDTRARHGRAPDLGTVADALGLDAEQLGAQRYFTWIAQAGRDLGRALQAVHDKGLIHRDVKPSNVLIDRSGSARLADFGIVRDGEPSANRTVSFVGTAQYAAPEQIRGDAPVDARADVYGLGATLYELLSLRPPAEGSMTAVLEAVEKRRVLGLDGLVDGIPRDLATVVERAIDHDPGRRYPTAMALADDLQAFLDNRPVSARRPTAAARALRWMQREPAKATAVAALAALVVVAGFTLTFWQAAEPARRAETAAQVRRLVTEGFLHLGDSPLSGNAMAPFEEAYRLDPDSPEALVGLVLAKTERYRRDEALQLLQTRQDLVREHPALQRLADAELLLYRIDPTEDIVSSPVGPSVSPLEAFVLGIANARRALGAERADLWQLAAHYLFLANQLDPVVSELYHTELARARSRAGDRAAVDVQRLALEHNFPDSWTAAYSLAKCYARIDPELALAECGEARQRGGDQRLCDLLEAAIHHLAGDDAKALAVIDRLLVDFTDEPHALGLGYLYRRESEPESEETLAWFERATSSLRARIDGLPAQDRDRDITYHQSLLELYKHRLVEVAGAWRRAVATRSAPDIAATTAAFEELAASALRAARDAVVRAPDSFQAHAAIGFWLSETRSQQALEVRTLLRAASRSGDDLSEDATRARRDYLANLAEARQHFERAVGLAPFHIRVARDYARFLLLHADDPEAAIEPIRRQVTLDPDSWEHRQVLGSTLVQIGRFEEGVEHLSSALAEAPERERHLPLSFRGRALLGLGQLEEARADLRACLELLEDRPQLRRTRCRVLTDLAAALLPVADESEPAQESLELIREALRLKRDNPESIAVLAEVQYAKGELEQGDKAADAAQGCFERQARMEIGDGATTRVLALADATARRLAAAREAAQGR